MLNDIFKKNRKKLDKAGRSKIPAKENFMGNLEESNDGLDINQIFEKERHRVRAEILAVDDSMGNLEVGQVNMLNRIKNNSVNPFLQNAFREVLNQSSMMENLGKLEKAMGPFDVGKMEPTVTADLLESIKHYEKNNKKAGVENKTEATLNDRSTMSSKYIRDGASDGKGTTFGSKKRLRVDADRKQEARWTNPNILSMKISPKTSYMGDGPFERRSIKENNGSYSNLNKSMGNSFYRNTKSSGQMLVSKNFQ